MKMCCKLCEKGYESQTYIFTLRDRCQENGDGLKVYLEKRIHNQMFLLYIMDTRNPDKLSLFEAF